MGVSGVLAQERREVRSSEGPRLEERVHIAGERERERVINKTKVRRVLCSYFAQREGAIKGDEGAKEPDLRKGHRTA
jgi:hypothetical protein